MLAVEEVVLRQHHLRLVARAALAVVEMAGLMDRPVLRVLLILVAAVAVDQSFLLVLVAQAAPAL